MESALVRGTCEHGLRLAIVQRPGEALSFVRGRRLRHDQFGMDSCNAQGCCCSVICSVWLGIHFPLQIKHDALLGSMEYDLAPPDSTCEEALVLANKMTCWIVTIDRQI